MARPRQREEGRPQALAKSMLQAQLSCSHCTLEEASLPLAAPPEKKKKTFSRYSEMNSVPLMYVHPESQIMSSLEKRIFAGAINFRCG